jgi:hypothetical protein
MLLPPTIVLALLVSSRFLWRARLRTEISRRGLGIVMMLPAAGVAHRALALALGATQAVILTGDLVIAAAMGGTLALTIAPRLGWAALPFAAGAIAIAAAPGLALPIFSTALLLGLIVMMLLWWRTVVTRGGARPRAAHLLHRAAAGPDRDDAALVEDGGDLSARRSARPRSSGV